jgi:hypothetical protein
MKWMATTMIEATMNSHNPSNSSSKGIGASPDLGLKEAHSKPHNKIVKV